MPHIDTLLEEFNKQLDIVKKSIDDKIDSEVFDIRMGMLFGSYIELSDELRKNWKISKSSH